MDPRIQFLQSASALYASTQPATSAHLRLQSTNVSVLAPTHDRSKPQSVIDHACLSCGTLFSPRTCHKRVTSSTKRYKTLAKSQPRSAHMPDNTKPEVSKNIETQCLVCRRVTKHPLPVASNKKRPNQKATENPRNRAALPDLVATSSSNLASKRRAKARKQGGLQALMANSRKQPNMSSNGLDLMDLMKEV
ncbi:Cullin-associated NEDD8-dissociated protein 1 [Varicellaria rhodocarpa]|nr:Cullin-associated NEDD8-dissociated protein 1 [Varicellaria rhodocarpa]